MSEAKYTRYRESAEQALVGIAFRDPVAAIDQALGIVSAYDFADSDLGEVYRVLADLHESSIRIERESVIRELDKRGTLDRIGRTDLEAILGRSYAVSNAQHYAREVARLSDHRRLVAAAERLVATADDPTADPEDMLARFTAQTAISRAGENATHLADGIDDMLADHRLASARGEVLGMQTGFRYLDIATTGMHRGQCWLLGARVGIGKTALALSIAANMASGSADGTRRGVVFFSLEMTTNELAERIVAAHCRVPYAKLCATALEQHHFDRIERENAKIRDWPFQILDRPCQTVGEIKAKAKLAAPKSGLDLIVVDTLQKVRPARRQDRRLELKQIVDDLKDIAKELNCAVLICAQLNADAEGVQPTMHHFSESKQVTESADTCVLLHREKRNSPDMLVLVAKIRRGPQSKFHLHFDGGYQRFNDNEPAPIAGSVHADFANDFGDYQ